MAIQTQYGKLSGTVESPVLPVTVWDDSGVDLAASAAVQAAQDAAPTTFFDWPQYSDPAIEQLNNSAYLVSISYRPRPTSTPTAPPVGEITVDYGMSFQAGPKYVYNAFECLGLYDTDGIVPGVTRLQVNTRTTGGVTIATGMQIDPMQETHYLDVIIPNGMFTQQYRNDLASLKYKFNDATFMGYPAGHLQLVRYSIQKRTDEDLRLSLGFGEGETLTDVEFDGNDDLSQYAVITVDEIPPTAIAWTVDRDVHVDFTEKIEKLADYVVVQRVWELGDFTKLGLGAL